MADEEGGNYDQTSTQFNSELAHLEGENKSRNVTSENTTGIDNEISPNSEIQEGKCRSSSDRSTKDAKGNKKSPNPNVQHSYVSLTVQERQARAEKLRQQRVIDLKKKENDRRTAFEERRKKLLAEENIKRDALLKKITASSPKQSRPSSRGSFGSSSPRLFSASTSNLSHMRKSHPVGRNIDVLSPSERSRSTSGAKDDLPKRPSSALHRPRSSLYLPRQHPAADEKSQTIGGRPASRSSSVRSTTRPQSAFGSSTARSATERTRVSPSSSTKEKPRVPPSASTTTRPALKKNITPSTTTARREPIKTATKPLPKPKLTPKTTSQRPLSATGDKNKSRATSKPKHASNPATSKEAETDKTNSVEKRKVIRKPPGLSTTQTVTTTTTTEIIKTENEPQVDNKKVIKRTKVEMTKKVEDKPEIKEPTAEEIARIEEAEQRDREATLEMQRREEEEKQQVEAEQRRREEEIERKAKEELERRAVEREHNKRLEEEARLERKKRVEMIMAKVSGKKDSPETPPSTSMDTVSPPQEETSEDDEHSSTKQRVGEILKRVGKPKEENENTGLFDSTENIFQADPPAITISSEEEPVKLVEPVDQVVDEITDPSIPTISLDEEPVKLVKPVNQESHSHTEKEADTPLITISLDEEPVKLVEEPVNQESHNISDEEIPKQISDNWIKSDETETTIVTMSQSEPVLDISSELKINDSIDNQSSKLQNQESESNTDNKSDFNLSEFDPIDNSIQNETSNDVMKVFENGNHFDTTDEVKANGNTFKVDEDQKGDEQSLWDEAEQHMATSKQADNPQFTVNKNSEEGKLWQVAEGQLELSECF